jgi:NAD(P)-dependent dehydrogenase (short-subunit alcohol dehydrogenase family)
VRGSADSSRRNPKDSRVEATSVNVTSGASTRGMSTAQSTPSFFGAVALTKAVLPHMRERGSGAIVQMSSQAGQMSFAGGGAYAASKFALEGI